MNLNPLKKKKNAFDYKAVVFVPSVDSMQQQTGVETKLIRDPEDNLLYLADTKTNGKKFKEIFPGENKEIFVNDELTNLENKLKSIEKKRKNIDDKSTDNYLNLEKEYANIKKLIAKLKEPKGSFTIQNSAGEKVIYFLRKSTGLSPIHFDIHNNQAYSPTEQQTKDAFNAWKTKYENLKEKKDTSFEKVTASIAAIVLILLVLGSGILFWKMFQHESDWDKMMLEQKYICSEEWQEKLQEIYDINKNTSKTMNNFVGEKFGIDSNSIESAKESSVK